MKRYWQIRRQFQPTADGARRWDQAYQYLVDWSHAPQAARRFHTRTTAQTTDGGHV